MTSHDNVTDIVEPSNAEQSEWPEATRDYVHALETENATLRKQLENARSEALEEAAAYLDDKADIHFMYAVGALAIRALKGQPC